MPKIIIRADTPGHEAPLTMLSERLVAENLESGHYAAQLVERITWATQDAEALEAHEGDGAVRTPTPADSESWTQPATSEKLRKHRHGDLPVGDQRSDLPAAVEHGRLGLIQAEDQVKAVSGGREPVRPR